jgi:type II secretion system protein N
MPQLEIPARLRGPLKYAGYTGFALLSFLTVAYVTFPYERVKDRLESELSTSGDYELKIGSLGPSPLFGVAASDVVLQARQQPGQQGGVRIALDRASVSVSPLLLLFGRRQVDFSVRAFGGKISGSYRETKAEPPPAGVKGLPAPREAKGDTVLNVKLSEVSLAALPGLRDALALPLTGAISGRVELTLPGGKLSQAVGQIELACEKCSVGDGKTRLKIPAAAQLFADGVLVDKVSLGQFGGKIVIEKGTARFEKFAAKSPDGELLVEGEIGLADAAGNSSLRSTYLSFRPSESCKKKQPFNMLDLALGATAKRPDGFFGFRVSGLLKDPKFVASKVAPVAPSGPGARPAVAGGPRRFEGGTFRPGGPGGPPHAPPAGVPGIGGNLRAPAQPGAFQPPVPPLAEGGGAPAAAPTPPPAPPAPPPSEPPRGAQPPMPPPGPPPAAPQPEQPQPEQPQPDQPGQPGQPGEQQPGEPQPDQPPPQ